VQLSLPLKKVLFGAVMVAGAVALGTGGVSIVVGHSSPWAFVRGTSFVLWGLSH
jgi:hypothetical protein